MKNRSPHTSNTLHKTQPYASVHDLLPSTPVLTHAPTESHQMGGGILSEHPSLFVQQKTNDWFQEMLGFQAETGFNVTTQEDKKTVLMYAIEESSFWMRFLLGSIHEWKMTLWRGAHKTGIPVAKYYRPLRLQPAALKCCCYQEIQHENSKGVPIGATTEDCWICVPRFNITDAHGKLEYILSKPTCLYGTCVNYWAEGICTCRVPFYIFEPGVEQVKGNEAGKLVKVWKGLAEQLFTDSDNFEVTFPTESVRSKESIEETRARLMGSLFLVNQLYFEGSSDGSTQRRNMNNVFSHNTMNGNGGFSNLPGEIARSVLRHS